MDFSRITAYLGLSNGGSDLRRAIAELPLDAIEALFSNLKQTVQAGGRVRLFGNGGSFDNARLITLGWRTRGINARTPLHPDGYGAWYRPGKYDDIFCGGLENEQLGPGDIAIGLSGSGNSSNVVKALSWAKQAGCTVFCLGGRDGGRMRHVCGDGHSVIAPHDVMEAIEDLHAWIGALVMEAWADGNLSGALSRLLGYYDQWFSAPVLESWKTTSTFISDTLVTGGRVFWLSTRPGGNHVRADFERGATNGVPIRGLHAPELMTTNRLQATCNDDGPRFMWIDMLAKWSLSADDVIIWSQCAGSEETRELTRAWALDQGLNWQELPNFFIAGEDKDYQFDMVMAVLGHAFCISLRDFLWDAFRIRTINLDLSLAFGDLKLTRDAVLKKENQLQESGELAEGECLTFCYGKPHVAHWTDQFGERCFY